MANTVSRRSVVYDILFDVESGKKSANEAEKEIEKLDKSVGGLEGSVKNLGKAFLGAFAIQDLTKRLIQFTTESVNLARASEGVRKAFERLNDSNLLNQLRAATRGTVNDLTLMQAAVRAQNFKIPLQQLGTYFDFASKRARDTGQSVDYLVNSIIDGIGRKSTLVLDNLGLSASDIQTEFAKTGDLAVAVGNIIQREMGDNVSQTDLAAESIDRYNVAIENLKEYIGTQLIPVLGKAAELMLDIFSRTAVEDLQLTRKTLTDEFEGIIERAPAQFQKLIQGLDASQIKILKTALEIAKATGKPIEDLIILEGIVGNATIGFTALGDSMRLTKKEAEDLAASQAAALIKVLSPFEQLNAKVLEFGKVLREVWRGERDANIKALNDQLSELKKELTETDLPRDRVIELTEKIATLESALKSLFTVNKDDKFVPETPIINLENAIAKATEEQKNLNTATEAGRLKFIELDATIASLNLQKEELLFKPLRDALDKVDEKTEKIKKELEELNKIKFTAPEEDSPELQQEKADLDDINAKIKKQADLRRELNNVISITGDTLGTVAGLAKQGSELQMALAISSILINQAQSISAAIKAGAEFGATTGPAALIATPTAIATLVGGVIATFAQVFSVINQAKAAQSQANAFAEGEVDIHRPGEVRGKDSIPAVIMPGESVITTDKTKKYKPFLQAIHEGNLEDLIRVSYVEPALALTTMEQAQKDSTIDYSQRFYKQLLATSDGNSINKRSVRILERIEKKIGNQKPSWYV